MQAEEDEEALVGHFNALLERTLVELLPANVAQVGHCHH